VAGNEEAAIGVRAGTANLALVYDGHVVTILPQIVSTGDADVPGANDDYTIRLSGCCHEMPLRNGSSPC
jgi:hypothetical protein